MRKVYVKLDGILSGFGVINLKRKQIVDLKLFESIELLKTYFYQEKDIYVSTDRNYIIVIVYRYQDECNNQIQTIIPINLTEYHNGNYEYIYENHGEYRMYVFTPSVIETVVNTGYFVFEHGDSKFVDKEYGKMRSDQLYNMIKEALNNILMENEKNYSITKIVRDENKHLSVSVKGSTYKLKVCFCSQLMNINQARKEDGNRCLPFFKNMDKFVTFYVYTTKDSKEDETYNNYISANRIRTKVVDYIKEHYPETEMKYVEVSFNGTIFMNGDE